ncbi:MAG: hypothetical protein ABIQ86_01655 [Steroidobacteraceae bacterium]
MARSGVLYFAARSALLPLVALLLVGSAVAANPTPSRTAPVTQPANASADSELDEFVIEGKKLSQLRKQIVEAEDRFYQLYNELNTDKDFDVNCETQAPLGTRITQRVCKPVFYAEAEAEYAQAMLRGDYAPPPELVALQRQAAYRAKALALINKNPELLRLLRRRDELERGYLKTRKERFKGHWIQF